MHGERVNIAKAYVDARRDLRLQARGVPETASEFQGGGG